MIKSIEIQNFQSHKNTKLKLSKGVNIIIGNTDSGKTAILRALRFVIWNKPTGNAFISDWADTSKVTLETNSDKIIRTKGKENSYKLNDTELKAFGTNPPDEITKAINIEEVNFQNQFEKHFLLNETAGNVAKFFNKIVNIEKIDTSLQAINSDLRKLNADLTYTKEENKKILSDLTLYDNLDNLESKVSTLEEKENKLKSIQTDLSILTSFVINIEQIQLKKQKLQLLLELEVKVTQITDAIKRKEKIKTKINQLQALINIFFSIKKKIKGSNLLLPFENRVNQIQDKITQHSKLLSKFERLTILSSRFHTTKENAEKTLKTVIKLEKQFDKEMGDVCVLCGSKLN